MKISLTMIIATLLLFSFRVQANPSDLFELDPLGKSTSGASSTVSPMFWTAAIHNPAALSGVKQISIGMGYSYGYMGLKVNGKDARVLDYRGSDVGVAMPLPKLFGKRIGFGATVHLPDQMLLRVQGIPASEPRFIMYDNYPHTMQMGIGAGISLTSWLYLGLGTSVMMNLDGKAINLNVGARGGIKTGEMEMDASLPYRIIPYGGMIFLGKGVSSSLSGVKLALFYREPYSFKLGMNIIANVDVAGIVTGDSVIALKALDHFSPRKVSLGFSFSIKKSVDIFAGLDWYQWSQFNAGISTLKILVDLGVNPPLVESVFPPDNFHDIFSPKFGVQFHSQNISFAGGYSFVPSPTPSQTGISTLMDNDRHVVSLGGGYKFKGPSFFPWPCQLYFSYQFHGLVEKTAIKTNPTLPSIQFGGSIHQISLGLKMEF